MNLLFLLIYTQILYKESSSHTLAQCVPQPYEEKEVALNCCARKLRCCDEKVTPTKFEVKAVLRPCAKRERKLRNHSRKRNLNQPESELNCIKKLAITVKINNVGLTNTNEQFIIIEHVFDDVTEKQQKLLRPYVIKITQEPITQFYNLTYEHLVNSEVRENVINKNRRGYTGCSTDPDHSTCNAVSYNGDLIPYSTGFCCSCDESINKQRQQQDVQKNEEYECLDNNFLMKQHQKGKCGMRLKKKSKKIDLKRQQYTIPEVLDANCSLDKVPSQKYQPRGGQDCTLTKTPPGVNPESYDESAHCLEFSDLWYSVYKVAEPKIKHTISVVIYEKHETITGSAHFKDLTFGGLSAIGSNSNSTIFNYDKTVSIAYKSGDAGLFALNPQTERILIPDPKFVSENDSPEVSGGPETFLVLEKNQLSRDGKLCDVAGVGYEAFFKQPDRCQKRQGTCLKNQPKELFMKDMDAINKGVKGCYFLKFYGVLTPEMLKNFGDTQNSSIEMFFTEPHASQMFIEVKADENIVLRPDILAMITEVYVDASSGKQATITVKVFNSGVTASVFSVGLSGCPLSVPAYLNNMVTKPALLAPQHLHIFIIDLAYSLPSGAFSCSVDVVNPKDEVIAYRKIIIRNSDRCICSWHCECVCLNRDQGLKCEMFHIKEYFAAGFQGGAPLPFHVVKYTFLDDMISMMLYIILFLCLLLLLMGLVKGLLGLFVNITIGLWGLDLILGLPRPINQYYEKDLKDKKVKYDCYGWPVHPETCRRVRNVAIPTEFCLNIVFFIIFPFCVCCIIIKRFFSSKYEDKNEYATQTQSELYCNCN